MNSDPFLYININQNTRCCAAHIHPARDFYLSAHECLFVIFDVKVCPYYFLQTPVQPQESISVFTLKACVRKPNWLHTLGARQRNMLVCAGVHNGFPPDKLGESDMHALSAVARADFIVSTTSSLLWIVLLNTPVKLLLNLKWLTWFWFIQLFAWCMCSKIWNLPYDARYNWKP
jgi:hypothetical protein